MPIKVLGDAAFVPLTRKAAHMPRRYTLVDIEDFERVTRSKWYVNQAGYVNSTSNKFLAAHHMLLHRYILRCEPEQRIDHISGDPLDNRKQNLRLASAAENSRNKKRATFPGKTSRFKGVCWSRNDEMWLAQIAVDGERIRLGLFEVEEDAARSYDGAATTLHGEFARTNADMRLYEMDNPFVANCEFADVFDKLVTFRSLSPHKHILQPPTYKQRLTRTLMKEIERHAQAS